jgi:hypothetical protein
MAMMRCGISQKDIKLTDKCSTNKTKTAQKQNDETTEKCFFQNTVKITQENKILT